MRLIGIHARLHAGKDTAYDALSQAAEKKGKLAVRRAFADPLKISGMRALGFSSAEYQSDEMVELANLIKETGRVTVTWDEVSEASGQLIPKSQVITGRQLWQLYGTEAHRADDLGQSFGSGFWVDNILPLGEIEPVKGYAPADTLYTTTRPKFWDSFTEGWAGFADIAVVTDVRFPNEAERVLELGGEVWWIDAEQRLGPNEDGHASEQRLADELITKTIDNNGTLDEFQANVLAAMRS